MKLSKRTIVSFALGLVVTAMGGAFAYHNLGHGESLVPTKFEPKLSRNGTEIVVRAYEIDSKSFGLTSSNSFTGTLQPRFQTPVGFRVAGKIASRKVDVGTCVRKGDVLFELDPTDFDLQLRVAESELLSAQSMVKQSTAEENRLEQLRKSGAVSQSDYDMGLATRDVALARLDAAEKRLALSKNQRGYSQLLADFDGLVTAVSGEVGQVVNIGQPVVNLMQGEELEAVVSLPENKVADVRTQQPNVSFWSRPELLLDAELRELSPIADPVSRTYEARFRLKGESAGLAIGMTTTVHLSNENQSGVSVPLSAIAHEESHTSVWKIDKSTGSVESVPVEVIQYRNETAIVRGNLLPGHAIVSAGTQRIDSGVRVRIWESQ